ncbi:SDR family NAD(P)-dependent oxidoreductase [Specibacter sp. NPDC057265]|uniref:SDR family NAD(P)-dependent oxidoreductase n=1 Tax=Specibacter sp. NPDC057265 TaxID=3346075 RepID=UPI00363D2077
MTKKIALVAGASRGLGLLLAHELGARGYRLVICARDADTLDAAAQQLRGAGFEVHPRVCDVGDNAAVVDLVAGIENGIGPIEVLITVAGTIQVGPLAELDHGHFEQAVSTMLWGPVNLALAVVEPMRRRGSGHIATVTSIGGMVSVPHLLPYSTAKFGAVGFSQGLRSELSGSGVSVTTIVPGLMRTGSHLRALFTGRQSAEYFWFSLGASTPVVSMAAERAAARMVKGVLAGRTMVVLTPLAKVAIRVHGLAPAFTAALLGRAGRLLPGPASGDQATMEGAQARSRMDPAIRAVHDRLTRLGRRAAGRFNEARP